MKRRDRAITYLLDTTRKFPTGVNFALSIGALFCGGVCGALFAGHPSKPNMLRNTAVLAAAPVRLIDGGVTNRDSMISNSPPPYVSVASVKEHRKHLIPSTAYGPDRTVTFSAKRFRKGGTTGTPPAWMACAKVDVWLPSSNIDMAPTMNDPNATVRFRILPPNNVFECGVWTYHYD
jgi:hypothetical protein